jgi:hypothetical protein
MYSNFSFIVAFTTNSLDYVLLSSNSAVRTKRSVASESIIRLCVLTTETSILI